MWRFPYAKQSGLLTPVFIMRLCKKIERAERDSTRSYLKRKVYADDLSRDKANLIKFIAEHPGVK